MGSDSKSLDDLYKLTQQVLDKNTSIETQLTELNSKFDNLSLKTNQISDKVLTLEHENKELKEKIKYLEQQHKKYNIVIYGIEETDTETFLEVENLLNYLQTSYNKLQIKDCYRIGKKEVGRARPVIVELTNYTLKKHIFEKAKQKKLNLRKIYITQDYTKEEYNWKKVLHSRVKIARKLGVPAKIIKNKLYVDGEEYPNNLIISEEEEEFKKAIIAQKKKRKIREENSTGSKPPQKLGYSTRSGGSRHPSNSEVK